MKITTIGLDLAKNVFQLHGADARGKAVLRKQLKRAEMLPFFARLEPCTVAMEACLSVHRAHQEFVKARTAQANQIRGLLAEFGFIVKCN